MAKIMMIALLLIIVDTAQDVKSKSFVADFENDINDDKEVVLLGNNTTDSVQPCPTRGLCVSQNLIIENDEKAREEKVRRGQI